jgi:hypothetical protein
MHDQTSNYLMCLNLFCYHLKMTLHVQEKKQHILLLNKKIIKYSLHLFNYIEKIAIEYPFFFKKEFKYTKKCMI